MIWRIVGLLSIPVISFLIYIEWGATRPAPQGPDGEVVLPIPDNRTDDRNGGRNTGPEKRVPKASAQSLELPFDVNGRFGNWDATLTLAQLSSHVYLQDRVDFAINKLGFEKAVEIVNGDQYALVCSTPKTIVVAFRGTHTLSAFLLGANLVPVGIGDPAVGCKVQAGLRLACDIVYQNSKLPSAFGWPKRL